MMILLVCLLVAQPAPARRRAAERSIVPAGHVVFVGAHPDDEVVAAPLLASLCLESGGTCSFLVLTRGEGGICALPACTPDLGTVREREMQASAAIFRGTVVQWDLPDVLDGVGSAWSESAGGREALLQRISEAIVAEHPDAVLTFSPQHGTTCHPAHRETAALVIEALARLGPGAPPVYLLETTVSLEDGRYRFGAGADPAAVFDAAAHWSYLVEVAAAHQSQFTAAQLGTFRDTLPDERKVWIVRSPAAGRPLIHCP
ncbi:MAG TPA: PIG-L family deacetylase [Thermoanaerobaculia bacterium]|nr:PIG-L family deacetylase [Thermoanaerobaculia bacterium]